MPNSIADYLIEFEDVYAPSVPKPSLQQWDNYQIYTLVCLDRAYTSRGGFRVRRTNITRLYSNGWQYFYTVGWGDYWPILSGTPVDFVGTAPGHQIDFLAYQAFSPTAIDIDFGDLISSLPTLSLRNIYHYELFATTQLSSSTIAITDLETSNDAILTAIGYYVAVADAQVQNELNPEQFTYVELTRSRIIIGNTDYWEIAMTIGRDIYTIGTSDNPIPSYLSLVGGYEKDPRIAPPNLPIITSDLAGKLSIGYYRRNNYEPINGLTSIDWVTYNLEITKGETTSIPLKDCVFGTLIFKGDLALTTEIKNKLADVSLPPNSYLWADYYYGSRTATLFAEWVGIYQSAPMPTPPPSGSAFSMKAYIEFGTQTMRRLAASNDRWHNQPIGTDLNFDLNHPMFAVDNQRAFTWHVASQLDGSFGTLTMDSPRIIEIHAALDAANFAENSIEPDEPRVTNLGHLIAKCAQLLGYHPNDNGEYIVNDEKKKTRRIVKDKEQVDEAEYGGNYFASKGMLFKRLPNAFDAKGEIVSGGVAMVHNIPELLAEIQDQLNIALNLQESGAIEIKDGDRAYRYAGQLQLLTDLALGMAAIHQLVHQGYISSLVTQQQSGEIIAGMGLPTVSRVTNVAIDNTLQQIPYWGIAPQHSLARKIETVGYNVGIITGQLI